MLAAAAVLPLLAYGAVSLVSLRSSAEQTVVEGNLNVARRAAEQVELYITSSVRIFGAVAADLERTGLERWQQDRILKNYVLGFPEFVELTLMDEDGHALVSSRLGAPSTRLPGANSTVVAGALMSPFSIDDDLLPSAVLASRTAGEKQGWLVGRLNLEEMWRLVDRIRVGQQGYALIVTRDGQLLAHGDPNAKSRVARGDSMSSHPLIAQLAVAGAGPTVSAEYDDARGRIVAVAARLPSLEWTVIVEQARDEAFAVPIRTQRQLAVAIGLALLAMLGAGYYWGRGFIDPILRLTHSSRALAAGRLDERVVVESSDELGQLGAAFNDMAHRLAELREDVRKKERQATFGRVVMGLVHDLASPIQNIGNSCKLLVKVFDDLQYRQSFQRTVEHELAQVRHVFDGLQNIAWPTPLERSPLDVNVVVRGLVDSMQTTAQPAGVIVETALASGPIWIEGNTFGLNRVYRNLIGNALHATARGGRIVVRTLRSGNQAVIEVADNGCGIAAEWLETIFDDFVTTKRRGLGLGLAISKRVVEQLGGTISASSEVGVGTTFRVLFPLMKTPLTEPAARRAETTSVG